MARKLISVCDGCGAENDEAEVMPGQVLGWYGSQLRKYGYRLTHNFLFCEPCAEKANAAVVDSLQREVSPEERAQLLTGEWSIARDSKDRLLDDDGSVLYDADEDRAADDAEEEEKENKE